MAVGVSWWATLQQGRGKSSSKVRMEQQLLEAAAAGDVAAIGKLIDEGVDLAYQVMLARLS